eukprot:2377215-Rhodomonas_salina.3
MPGTEIAYQGRRRAAVFSGTASDSPRNKTNVIGCDARQCAGASYHRCFRPAKHVLNRLRCCEIKYKSNAFAVQFVPEMSSSVFEFASLCGVQYEDKTLYQTARRYQDRHNARLCAMQLAGTRLCTSVWQHFVLKGVKTLY